MFSAEKGYAVLGNRSGDSPLEQSSDAASAAGDMEDVLLDDDLYEPQHQRGNWAKFWLYVLLASNALLFVIVVYQYRCLQKLQSLLPPYSDFVYSPAQDSVSYKRVTFTDGLLDPPEARSIYLGPPTNETDAAWQELYDIGGINQILASEASKLEEATAEVLDEPGYNFVGLDVFHQLHCLNWIRMSVRPQRYKQMSMEGMTEEQKEARFIHIDHCIDSLRQSLMCSADVSPVIWKWKKQDGLVQNMNNTHVCKDFEQIKAWARARMLTREINSRLPEDQVLDIVAEASTD